jgi:ribulose bisphosphate carboxylase small subunit
MSNNPTALRTVKKPELVTVGTRAVSVNGWHFSLSADHLKEHLGKGPSKKWCGPACMASRMFGRSSPANQQRVRDRIAKAFHYLLQNGMFLAIEYVERPHRTISAFKILETTEGMEMQHARAQIERMRQRREVNEEKYLKALELLGSPQAPSE